MSKQKRHEVLLARWSSTEFRKISSRKKKNRPPIRMWMPSSIWCWRVNWWRACVRARWWLPKMFPACQGFAYPWRKVALRGAGYGAKKSPLIGVEVFFRLYSEFFSEVFSEPYAVCCWVQILVHLYSWKRMKKRSNVNFSYDSPPFPNTRLSLLQGSWS